MKLKKFPRWAKVVLTILLILVAGIAYISYKDVRAAHKEQNELLQELTALPIPTSCVQKSKRYSGGEFGQNNGWDAAYDCNTTTLEAYTAVSQSMQARGYIAITAFDDRKDSYRYVKEPDFSVSYFFDIGDGVIDAEPKVKISAEKTLHRLVIGIGRPFEGESKSKD